MSVLLSLWILALMTTLRRPAFEPSYAATRPRVGVSGLLAITITAMAILSAIAARRLAIGP